MTGNRESEMGTTVPCGWCFDPEKCNRANGCAQGYSATEGRYGGGSIQTGSKLREKDTQELSDQQSSDKR